MIPRSCGAEYPSSHVYPSVMMRVEILLNRILNVRDGNEGT